jgi:hypothetical protein
VFEWPHAWEQGHRYLQSWLVAGSQAHLKAKIYTVSLFRALQPPLSKQLCLARPNRGCKIYIT